MVSGRAECSEASLSSTVSAKLSAMVNLIQGWEEGYVVPVWALLKYEGHCGRKQKDLVWKSEERVTEMLNTQESATQGVKLEEVVMLKVKKDWINLGNKDKWFLM